MIELVPYNKPGQSSATTKIEQAQLIATKLPDSCNPVRITYLLKEEDLPENRFFLCKYYSRCLEIAALLHWTSFTCYHCSFNENLTKLETNKEKKIASS